MFALIFVLVAIHSVKNTAIDLAAVIRGQTPPSHQRQMARIAAGTARRAASPRGTMGSFFSNAYGDAWESANDWRERKAKIAARNRRAKWAEEDAEFAKRVPAPVDPTAPPKPTEVPKVEKVAPETTPAPKQAESGEPAKTGGDGTVAESVAPIFGAMAADVAAKLESEKKLKAAQGNDQFDASEAGYQRYAMRVRNGGKVQSPEQLQEEFGLSRERADELAASWDRRYKNEIEHKATLKATYARECAEAMKLHDAGHKDEAQVHIDRAADAARRMGITSEAELFALYQETQSAQQKEAQSQNTAGPGSNPTVETQKEVLPVTATTVQNGAANAETIGLRAGLTFLNGMATQCTNGAANTEISATSLAAGEVGPGVTGPMAEGQELLNAAAAKFAEASKKLEESITVAEAYAANPDAGNKQFLTTD